MFDTASRARYSTDASIYQIQPIGVVVPRSEEAARAAIAIAVEEGIPILPRGAGSSQCGQAVGEALVIDHTKYLNRALQVDPEIRRAIVQPGMVLDTLNAQLRKHGLWFPVDVSTSAQATLGGMTGNNSCGSRSIAYGNMVHNVLAVDAFTTSGERWRFGPMDQNLSGSYGEFIARLKGLYQREKQEIEARFPKVLRKVAGYNLDHLGPPHANAAHLLVGSEGTLAYSERIHLKLAPLPDKRSLGVCHFPKFYTAMELTQHIVKLGPSAVELVDRTMINLAREIPAFAKTVNAFIKGDPDAILLVELADERAGRLKDLVQLMADLGLPGSVVEVTDEKLQKQIWDVRKAGLNIMMSMKGDGKPVSFIEDCAVPLEHLAEYTDRLTRVFEKNGTRGTWYAHASVGTLHVRPILDMRRDGAEKMRAIAEEACAMVKEYKGAYSGEHGDGLVRSEWIAPFFGPRLTAALGEIKSWLDPKGLMNPGKIVNPSRMDERTLFRFKPGYETHDGALSQFVAFRARHRRRPDRRLRQGRRDVQQQRSLPQVRRRHHVSVVPRDPGRKASDPRTRQYAASCAFEPAGRRGRGGGESRPGSLRLLQRLQARVPDRRRHGAHEGRVPRALQGKTRPERARSRHRLFATLCILGRTTCPFNECDVQPVQGRTGVRATA